MSAATLAAPVPKAKSPAKPPAPTLTAARSALCQRKCACGGSSGSDDKCEDCQKKEMGLQRFAAGPARSNTVPPIVHEALRSPGQPLDRATRAFMEPRFGHDFSRVRIHTDGLAAESANAVAAHAYTVGGDIVFGTGRYAPGSENGRRLLAHELVHVIQQDAGTGLETLPPAIQHLSGGGARLTMALGLFSEPQHLENEALTASDRILEPSADHKLVGPLSAAVPRAFIQRARLPLPTPQPLCGKTLTHIDVLPWAIKDLEPCLPKGVPVTRVNIVGRDLSTPTSGMGPQVFNLHVGYYQDPATGRYCGIARDSKVCVAPACQFLGCFPTLEEVLEVIWQFVKAALVVIGVVLLGIIVAILIELLAPILVPAGALATGALAAGAPKDGEGGTDRALDSQQSTGEPTDAKAAV